MSFINKLNNTYKLLNDLDNILVADNNKNFTKKLLLSITEDLANYKEINEQKHIKLQNDEIKSKITNILNRINEIETNVKNKLIITEKYNAYLNS